MENSIFKIGLGVPIALIILLAMMILPIPPIILDMFFTSSITISLLVLLSSIYCLRPLDFASFPTIILLTTLLRLALNVASTRVVLLNGHTGTHAAGQVIQSFGEVVIGGSYTVGFVVFIILVIINFVVVTKGAGRISEVSARFTLDAMPGKQMAIDADLNAGLIEQNEAKSRREELAQEADFYGSMDGASKFVRGDAVAGILILLINMVGGIIIGVVQHDMDFATAIQTYALLTIGDGLIAQIPALILSVAAAMMVSRVSKSEDMSKELAGQIFANPKALIIAAGILFVLSIIPGMPHVAFGSIAIILAGTAYYVDQAQVEPLFAYLVDSTPSAAAVEQETIKVKEEALEKAKSEEITWDDVPAIDTIGLEVGYRIIPLVDEQQSGELMSKIKGVRKKISQELGFLVPTVHIKDNLDLVPNAYRISFSGVTVGESKIYPDKDLAINPGQVFGELEGNKVKDPSFGLDAAWIEKSQRQNAQTLGYTVVDASTVVATHLSQEIQKNAHKLIGHAEVQKLLDIISQDTPKLVEDLIPKVMSSATLLKVMQNLLQEHVPVRDIRTILETLSDMGQKTQDPSLLTEYVRTNLGAMIVQQINGFANELNVLTLEPDLEQILQKSMQATEDNSIVLEPGLAENIQKSLFEFQEHSEVSSLTEVLLVSSAVRIMMSKFARSVLPNISVLSYQEIPDNIQIKVVGTIGK